MKICISDTQNALLYSTGVAYVIEPPMTTTEQNFTKDMDQSHAHRKLCFKISSLEKGAPKTKETNIMTSSFRAKATEIQNNWKKSLKLINMTIELAVL